MLTITPNKPVYKTKIVKSNTSYPKNKDKFQDNVAFKGTIIRPAKNKAEIIELVNLFYDAVKHNLEPNKKTLPFLEKIQRRVLTFPFLTVAKKASSVTEIVKAENKLVGGYSMNINPINSSAHIGFITLAPEYMRTKSGIGILKTIGERICQNGEINNVKELTWTTNSTNKQINRLLKRFSPERVRKIASETEYKISLEDFKDKLMKI